MIKIIEKFILENKKYPYTIVNFKKSRIIFKKIYFTINNNLTTRMLRNYI